MLNADIAKDIEIRFLEKIKKVIRLLKKKLSANITWCPVI